MNIYRIAQSENEGWTTYDSAVVVAATEDDARKVHPSEHIDAGERWYDEPGWGKSSWAAPAKVSVKLIGVAAEGLEAGTVIYSSFMAC